MDRDERNADGIARAKAEAAGLVRDLAAVLAYSVWLAVPWAIRGVYMALALGAAAGMAPAVFVAYGGDLETGGDPAAIIPAGLIAILPAVIAVQSRRGWPALALGGAGTLALGAMVLALDPIGRSFLIVATIAGIVYYGRQTGISERKGAEHDR